MNARQQRGGQQPDQAEGKEGSKHAGDLSGPRRLSHDQRCWLVDDKAGSGFRFRVSGKSKAEPKVGSRKSEVGSRKSEVGKTGFEFFGDLRLTTVLPETGTRKPETGVFNARRFWVVSTGRSAVRPCSSAAPRMPRRRGSRRSAGWPASGSRRRRRKPAALSWSSSRIPDRWR